MPETTPIPPGPLNVLLVVDQDVDRRLGGLVWHLCVGLVDEPVRVTILARASDYAVESIGPSRVVCLPRRLLPWPRLSDDEILELIGDEPPDLIHCLSAELASWAMRWANLWEVPLLCQLTDLDDVERLGHLPGSSTVHALAISALLEEAACNRRRDLAERVYVVQPGLPAQKEAGFLCRPERIPAVVVACPLDKHCGLDAVLKALAAITQGGQNVQLFVLSEGPAVANFHRLVEQLQLRAHVTFAGPFDDWGTLRDAIYGGDVFILPNGHQRFTLSTLTAMAGGLAVLAPKGTTEDYLIDGVTASLFDPRQSNSLRNKWSALLNDHAAARRLAYGALDHVRAHYQASTMASATARIYQQLRQTPVAAKIP